MRFVLPIIMLFLALVLVIFGVQNTQTVNVRFLNFETGRISVALVMVVSALFGAALTGLFSLWFRIRYGIQSWRTRRQQLAEQQRKLELEKRVSTLEQENQILRTTGRLGEATANSTTAEKPSTTEHKSEDSSTPATTSTSSSSDTPITGV
jgi:uncharacterized integral membrane protein